MELDGPLSGLPVTIILNGAVFHDRLPIKFNDLDPGSYVVRVERDGYRPWEQSVTLQANQRIAFEDVFLTYKNPEYTQTNLIAVSDSRFINQDTKNLEIKAGNELWVDGSFITRTSTNLYNAQWLPQHHQVSVQSGSDIILIDPISGRIQPLITLPTTEVVSYFFEEGGRILTYHTTEAVWRAELFERSSLFKFL
jgi:hypothetical protein